MKVLVASGYNIVILERTGPEAELSHRVLSCSNLYDSAGFLESALLAATCVAAAVIYSMDGCQKGVAAKCKPHYITQSDWDKPWNVVFVGSAEDVPGVTTANILSLVRLISLVKGL